jgi:hypothetical protein
MVATPAVYGDPARETPERLTPALGRCPEER